MKTILIADDSNSSRDITSHFLQQGGFRVLEAEDGLAALEVLEHRHVDLILTDIVMPRMDGWGFYAEVRKQRHFNLTPFVFLSVLDDLNDQIKGLTLGVDDYLSKPITPQQLLARVNTALTRRDRMASYFFENPVTGLATEHFFRENLKREKLRAGVSGRPLSLVVFGIGNYVSLVRGHAEWFAESASRKAGRNLQQQGRTFDIIADMGQGRFAALLPEATLEDAKNWANSIASSWSISLVWPATEQSIPVDIGYDCVSVSDAISNNPLEILDKQLTSFERKW